MLVLIKSEKSQLKMFKTKLTGEIRKLEKKLVEETSTKSVHSCVIQTKSNKFKQSLTKPNRVYPLKFLKMPQNP